MRRFNIWMSMHLPVQITIGLSQGIMEKCDLFFNLACKLIDPANLCVLEHTTRTKVHLRRNLLVMMQPLQLETSYPHSWLTVPSPHLHSTQTHNRARFCLQLQRGHIQTTLLSALLNGYVVFWAKECEKFSLRRLFLDPEHSQNNCCTTLSVYQSKKKK